MSLTRMNFNGDINLGMYGFATDKYCLTGFDDKKIRQTLDVPVFNCTILNMSLIGIFVTGNSHGIIISDVVDDYDSKRLKQQFENILVLRTKYTALGNLVLMNDNGIIISPLLRKHRKDISDFFGIPCEATAVSNQKVVGTLALTTNKGCLTHPKIRKKERETIERVLGVKSDIGTVNFGSPYPGAGVIANSNGFIASVQTSGPELGRITEALDLM